MIMKQAFLSRITVALTLILGFYRFKYSAPWFALADLERALSAVGGSAATGRPC
jgi:hypothetical protein